MDKIVYKIVFDRKKRPRKDGKALVQVCAYLGGKRKYFTTHIYLSPGQWDERRQRVRRHPHATELNRMLRGQVEELEGAELGLWRQGHGPTLPLLKEAFLSSRRHAGFLDFCRREAEAGGLKESTRASIRRTLSLLQAYRKDAAFAEINFGFIAAFEDFLLRRGYHVNTVGKHLKHLRRYVNAAIRKGFLPPEPYAFRDFRIKAVPCKHTHLTPCELECLENLASGRLRARLCRVLDAFLFCCYTGVRYSDFVRLGEANFVKMRQETWLAYKSQKTGSEVRMPLDLLFEGKALSLLRKYAGNLGGFFKIPDNSNTNKLLARLAAMAGIEKPVSFHTARHTNATLLLYRGVSLTTVQKILGHKNVKATQVYADIMDMTVARDLEKAGQAGKP